MSLIVLTAAPDVVALCAEDYGDGKWIKVDTVPVELRSGNLLARRTGKVARRKDLMSAPVFEFRLPKDWEGTK